MALLLLTIARVTPASAAELVLSQMTYVGSEAGEPGLVLVADRARIEPGGEIAHLEVVRLDADGEAGEASLELVCDRARLNLTTSDFTAEGNVRGRTADGHRFTTETADFSHAKRIIRSTEHVDIIDPLGTHLEGSGFRYDVRRKRMKMQNAIVSELSEESNQ